MRQLLQELLHKEQRYLDSFFSHLPLEEVERVLELCLASKGILLFSGVGKSGLIAKKIAATMISTGTKALSLSPTDAGHGDLGMMTKEDVFIVLSKSGESDELLQLIPFVRNKGAQVISIVCEEGSRLEKASDHVVHLPFEKELCPFDMAPTVSTTIQMVFGDLMAIALMRQKKFPLDQYALNHPAGRIGRRLSLRVQDLMVRDQKIPKCRSDALLFDTLVDLSDKRCGCVLVVDEKDQLQGIFTDGDLRRSMQQYGSTVLQQSMSTLMTEKPKWISPDTLATKALDVMEEEQKRPITALPVLDEKQRVVGLVRMHDLLQTGL